MLYLIFFGLLQAIASPEVREMTPVPADSHVQSDAPTAAEAASLDLPMSDWEYLQDQGWEHRVGEGPGVWISVEEQMLRIVQGTRILWEVPCATAAKGTGSLGGSMKTPLGWHKIGTKVGDGAPWGQVFRSRVATREIWKPGQASKEDLVLTRVMVLDGLEPGQNQGRNAEGKLVDSRERCIYIHGTNQEELIGTPSSHGCIRLRNDDVISAYEKMSENLPVLITERATSE
ncbi:MAG: L,D-transpeptidase [Candidatus Hydrogenedentes bacterium]|nr:L,D-transpeptidase [Candidatus Hydrogenedentota bacterium]